jgi:hypothetical protein
MLSLMRYNTKGEICKPASSWWQEEGHFDYSGMLYLSEWISNLFEKVKEELC